MSLSNTLTNVLTTFFKKLKIVNKFNNSHFKFVIFTNIYYLCIMKKFEQLVQREVVDTTTGEIITYESSKTFTKKIESDKFYITFIEYIAPFYDLKSNTAKDVLCWMCSHAEWNTGKVALTTNTRKDICNIFKISPNTLTNSLKKLKELKLISGEKGDFIINPQIFWKGDLKERKRLLEIDEIKVTFDINIKQ